ncbi:MAG TPA: hypothetical protein VJ349_05550, partial [Stellaceae bacterium]|nr:hypothetical protein [Stellaceae bacterium]
ASPTSKIMQRLHDGGLLVINAGLDPNDFPGQNLKIPGDGHSTGVANRAWAVLVRDVLAALAARATNLTLAPLAGRGLG